MRKLAVFIKGFGAEINVAVNGICVAVFNKTAYDFDNLINVFGCLGVNIGRSEIEALCISPEFFDIFFCYCIIG